MITLNDVRHTFLDYFCKNGHALVKSSSLIPHNDPTLMFTSAGMVQFKNLFTGQEKRDYTRATTAQKCLRAGGKHNDLENVGYTTRHHTFFEMLGNFSFGDYFKEEAIPLAWDLLTKQFDLSPDRLLVTVYHTDDEAAAIWKKVTGFGDDKILRIATSDNFWSAGDVGPCGPCTEIFFDHGEKFFGGPPGTPDEDGERFVEIWNNVFMQFDQLPDGSRVDLPRPSIDTGMGLERITAILMGKHDNYDIDLMRALIETSAHLTGTDPDGAHKVSHRVIADHLRAAAFLIADGVMPSNEGRGYVLRRIMRRGMRHAHLLGAQDPLMDRIFPALADRMGDAYPELREAAPLIAETLRLEEERFKRTLDTGLSLLAAETAKLAEGEALPGTVAFKLYDTYGFPLDLTEDVLRRDGGRAVDVSGFEAAMEKQREVARKSWAGSGEAATEAVWFAVRARAGASEFLGYATTEAEGAVVALVRDGAEVESARAGDRVAVVFNQTPFYAESGGQVGDTGTARGEGFALNITDCQKRAEGLVVHMAEVTEGEIKAGATALLSVDAARRDDIRANHSATHLLHAALRRHLGAHVTQKGSRVDSGRLRFDISQPTALTEAQIAEVEAEVNDRIRGNSEVTTRLMPIEDARKMGAMALFGEKYDDEVRVVAMGGQDLDDPERIYSLELCGGTHVRRTGDIGLFRIVSEGALAAGIRRVEAVTGRGALALLREQSQRLETLADLLKASPAEVAVRVEGLLSEKKRLEKEVSDLRRKLATGGAAEAEASVKVIKGVNFTSRLLQGVPANELKPLADDLKARLGSGVVALVSVAEDGKASLVVGVTPDLAGRINAVDLVKTGAARLGGKGGGGRPDMAQAGGPEGKDAAAAVASIEDMLSAFAG